MITLNNLDVMVRDIIYDQRKVPVAALMNMIHDSVNRLELFGHVAVRDVEGLSVAFITADGESFSRVARKTRGLS